jgi:hypothetical protein
MIFDDLMLDLNRLGGRALILYGQPTWLLYMEGALFLSKAHSNESRA